MGWVKLKQHELAFFYVIEYPHILCQRQHEVINSIFMFLTNLIVVCTILKLLYAHVSDPQASGSGGYRHVFFGGCQWLLFRLHGSVLWRFRYSKPLPNYPEFMTRILHLFCDLLLKAFDFECGHNVRLAKLDVITACAIARCNENMLFCLCFHIRSPAIFKSAALLWTACVFFYDTFSMIISWTYNHVQRFVYSTSKRKKTN